MSGRVTVFTAANCVNCEKAKSLLTQAGAKDINEIDLVAKPEWKPLLHLLTGGHTTPPLVFFNDSFMGGLSELEQLDKLGNLESGVQLCLYESDSPPFPELRQPESAEYFDIVPTFQRQVWQGYIEELAAQISTPDKRVELVMMMMDTPSSKMVVVCSTGAASDQFKVGATGADKKQDGSQEKLYCQVVMEDRETCFFNGPDTIPEELSKNIDLVKYGYGYYLGTPWRVADIRGTIVALEKSGGVLKDEHVPIIESVRSKIEKEWSSDLMLLHPV